MTRKAKLEKQELSEAELETYSRQIVLGDIGYDGQLKLRNGKACIIGLGGLGSLIAPRLVGMGIGHLRIVDRDIVSRSDLHRQYLYDVDAVGRPKVEIAYDKLRRLNPDVEIDPIPASLNSSNAEELIHDMDVVLDGLDSPEPRYVVNRTCIRLKIPYAFGAAIQAFGNLTTIVPGKTLCLECFMSGLREEDLPKCGVVGVHPSVLGVVTAIQTSEAVRILMGQEPKLLNRILYINLTEMNFDTIDLTAQRECPICGVRPRGVPEPIPDRLFEETCARDGRRNFIITPRRRIEIDFVRLRSILDEKGFPVKTSGLFGMTFEQSPDVMMSILKSGIMITQASPRLKNNPRDDVLQTYRSILVGGLGFPPEVVPEE